MKNRLLAIVRGGIPYIKELRPLCDGSLTAALLFQQAEYWFDKCPDGFYKFIQACGHELYKSGDSWCEELGYSDDEFRTAWRKIGITYTSRKAFLAKEDPFRDEDGQEHFYCAIQDRLEGITWYYRNHDYVDKTLDNLVNPSNHQETEDPGFRKPTNRGSGNQESPAPETEDPGLVYKEQKTTPQKTTEFSYENSSKKTSPRAREKFSQDPDPPQNEPLILEMMAIESPGGTPLNRRQAERICKTYGPEACRKQLDWLPYRSRQNPVAVFQAALKDNLPAPKAWLAEQAEAQQKKEAELQARSAEADLQARRDADRDQKARLAAEKAAWDALPLEEQQAILDERERQKQLEEQQRRENNPVSKAKAALAAQGITKERALIPPIPPSPRNYPEASS